MFYTCQAGALDKADLIFILAFQQTQRMLNAKLQCLRKTAKKSHKKQLGGGLHYVCCSLRKK